MIQFQLKSIAKKVKYFFERIPDAFDSLSGKKKHMDLYCDQAPHPQNIVDLFQNEWVGKFPAPYGHLVAGKLELYNDSRINWALDVVGEIKGKKILELGPMEGAHSYLLQKHGAASVIAIEGNPRAYMRCLAVKQILNLNRVEFLYGDFTKYLKGNPISFDLCLACGVLYHMQNPIELIANISKSSSKVFVWTHYYDPTICRMHSSLKYNLHEYFQSDYEGFKHTLFKHHYGPKSHKWFFGGPAPFSHWLTKEAILDGCKYFGLKHIEISKEHDEPHHVNGPAFAFVASKS